MVKLKCVFKGHSWAVVSTKDGIFEKCSVCGKVNHPAARPDWRSRVILKEKHEDDSK